MPVPYIVSNFRRPTQICIFDKLYEQAVKQKYVQITFNLETNFEEKIPVN